MEIVMTEGEWKHIAKSSYHSATTMESIDNHGYYKDEKLIGAISNLDDGRWNARAIKQFGAHHRETPDWEDLGKFTSETQAKAAVEIWAGILNEAGLI